MKHRRFVLLVVLGLMLVISISTITLAQTPVLPLGETQMGTVTEAGSPVSWTIDGQAEETFYIIAEAVDGELIPLMILQDNEGYVVANSMQLGNNNALLSYTPTADTDYLLNVSAYSQNTGDFEITMVQPTVVSTPTLETETVLDPLDGIEVETTATLTTSVTATDTATLTLTNEITDTETMTGTMELTDTTDITGTSEAETGEEMAAADGTTIDLRLMETTDIHVHIMNYDYFRDQPSDEVGLAQTASLIKAARDEVTNSILVDNGDLIQGNPLGDYMANTGLEEGQLHPVYKAMNLLDYEVGNIGNHEFNYGLEFLNEALNDAAFPYISANVYDAETEENYFTPYLILPKTLTDTDGNAHELNIGYIGFVPPQITQWDRSHLEGEVTTADIVETAETFIPLMEEEGADLIVAIPHSGLDVQTRQGFDENASYYLSQVPGIDAILFGHAHRVFPSDDYAELEGVDLETGTINGVPAVMPGFWANHLGIIDMTLQQVEGEWQVVSSQSEARPISERVDGEVVALVETDAEIVEAVADDHQATLDWIREPFGETEAAIHSFFALVQDDPSIQIVTDAQKWYVERFIQGTEYDGMPVLSAGAPFKAGRGGPDDYTYVPEGTIAFSNVADLYIYPNTLNALLLTGSEVHEWLEMSAGQFNQIDPDSTEQQQLVNSEFPTFNFDVIDGVTYEIDVTQPPRYDSSGELINPDAQRIVNLMYEGEPISEEQQFIVASNNYRASGGGNFPGITTDKIAIDAPDANRQVLANYIAEQGTFNPSADGNWSFAPINDTVEVVFLSSPSEATTEFAEELAPISPTDETTVEGFAIYQLDMAPAE